MRGRRLRVRWAAADTAAALHAAYRAEADAAVRMRLHGLWLLRAGRTVGAVAAAVGVHERTVQRWVRWYEQGGLATVHAHRQGGVGQPSRLTAEQQEQVATEVATGRFRSSAEIGAWIADTFGVQYRPGGLSSLLARAWDADPTLVRRLAGWEWIADACAALPADPPEAIAA